MSRVALVAGCTGVQGSHLVGHLLNSHKDWTQVIALSRSPCEKEPWWGHPKLKHIAVDLLDKDAVHQRFKSEDAVSRVTHAFFAAYAHSNDDDELTRMNGRMFENFLEQLDAAASRHLQRVCLVTGTKYYGVQYGPYKTPSREDDPRLDKNIFYYAQEDCLARLQRDKHWTWTVLRPQDILGFSWKSGMNQGVTLAVYAVLCKALGLPFIYPGTRRSYSMLYDSSSVRTVVRMLEWASLTPGAANEAFNCVNGDVYRMEHLWPVIGRYFGLEAHPPPETGRFRLQEQVGDMRLAWREIVRKYGLADSRLEDLVTWEFTDFICGREYDSVTDMTKARETGFLEYFATDKEYIHFFDRLKALRIIPDFGTSALGGGLLLDDPLPAQSLPPKSERQQPQQPQQQQHSQQKQQEQQQKQEQLQEGQQQQPAERQVADDLANIPPIAGKLAESPTTQQYAKKADMDQDIIAIARANLSVSP